MATEGIFSSFKVSAMGLKAQRLRLDVAAENLANAETTRTPEGGPYRPKTVVFSAREAKPEPRRVSFSALLDRARELPAMPPQPTLPELEAKVATVADPVTSEYAPGHPDADADGVLLKPNINPVD